MRQFFNKTFLISIIVLVGIYTVTAWIFNIRSERETTIDLNVAQLKGYVQVAEKALQEGQIREVASYFPKDIRLTVVDREGRVTFDTDSAYVGQFENHSKRRELKSAHYRGSGYAYRVSASTGDDSFYYAEYFKDHYVRVAVPNFLTPEHSFRATRILLLLGILILFFMAWKMYLASQAHADHLKKLENLPKKIASGEEIEPVDIPKKESDVITHELLELLRQKELTHKEIEHNRERLALHFEVSNVGIGIFNARGETQFTNSHFIQYANMISRDPITEVGQILDDPEFQAVKAFAGRPFDPQARLLSVKMNPGGHSYEVQCITEEKGGYEITITDITEAEKNRVLKQELTGNITHELRTPLTAIKGYLEMLSFQDLSSDERTLFTDKALAQSARLASLLDDISLLSKLEDPSNNYTFETIDLKLLVEEVRIAFADRLAEAGDSFHNNLPDNLLMEGNHTLLTSVFQNLTENALRYAGSGISIEVTLYHKDAKYLYLSFRDTGIGVDERHLGRIFERFYRVDEGRTRAKGGTGLGLSIVRNAISFHGGQAHARRSHSGGLEIMFTLRIVHNV